MELFQVPQRDPESPFEQPRKRECHSQLLTLMLDRTFPYPRNFPANPKLKMAIDLKKTKYLEHLDLEYNLLVVSHLDHRQQLHHLVHRKLEFGVPTTIGERCTNHACYPPTQNI